MYIEDKRVKANDTFGKLCEGDCFTIVDDYDEEVVCMKVCVFDEKGNKQFKTINLDSGVDIAVDLDENAPVQKVNARITIW